MTEPKISIEFCTPDNGKRLWSVPQSVMRKIKKGEWQYSDCTVRAKDGKLTIVINDPSFTKESLVNLKINIEGEII